MRSLSKAIREKLKYLRGLPRIPNQANAEGSYLRWTPHPEIVTIRDNRDYIRVLLYSYYTTITGWGGGGVATTTSKHNTHHNKTLSHHGKQSTTAARQNAQFFGCQVLFYELPDFRRPTFRANVEPLFESFANSVPLFRTPKCALPLPPPPPPLRAPYCLGARILELSSAQNTKTCTAAPPLIAQNCLQARILELSSVQNIKTCTPACPPSQRPKLPGSTHFGTFKRPKH